MNIQEILKNMSIHNNITIRVIDNASHKIVSEHTGHNQATNTLLLGVAHYLNGDGVLNQSSYTLSNYIPRYISLGTMGLYNQECDEFGLPTGIGVDGKPEVDRFKAYMEQTPGYGADGYGVSNNNSRPYYGLGRIFANRPDKTKTVNCELISPTFPRSEIMYRGIIPEAKSEIPETIDVVFSAMISTGALAQFREPGKDYVFITEVGLWSRRDWSDSKSNGLLAGYRIIPPDESTRDMTFPQNRDLLRKQIIRVNKNQVVQVIWKIQIISKTQTSSSFRAIDRLNDKTLTLVRTNDVRYFEYQNDRSIRIQDTQTVIDYEFELNKVENSVFKQVAFQANILADVVTTGNNPTLTVKYILNDSESTTWVATNRMNNGLQILNLIQPIYKYDLYKNHLNVEFSASDCIVAIDEDQMHATLAAITDWSGDITVEELDIPAVQIEKTNVSIKSFIDYAATGIQYPDRPTNFDTFDLLRIQTRNVTYSEFYDHVLMGEIVKSTTLNTIPKYQGQYNSVYVYITTNNNYALRHEYISTSIDKTSDIDSGYMRELSISTSEFETLENVVIKSE